MNMPLTGTYGVIVHPYYDSNETMSFDATVSHDIRATLTSGVGYPLNLSLSGQNAWLGFAGTAGTNRTLQITNIPAGKTMRFTVYKPDWTVLQSDTSSTSSYTFNLTNLPTPGTYTLFVDPNYGATATMTVTVQ
jgi:hypothetical protein